MATDKTERRGFDRNLSCISLCKHFVKNLRGEVLCKRLPKLPMCLQSQSTGNLVEVKFNRNQFQYIEDWVLSLSLTEFNCKASVAMSWMGLNLKFKNHTPK